jgi:peptidoglycan/xylan/chitin deacetylase (PgdA/CDA1 family)
MKYPLKFPNWICSLFPQLVCRISTSQPTIYLTFDDGPHPIITPKILDILEQFNAKASFFFTGKNILQEPNLVKRIIKEGHAVGNHTYSHMDGWKTPPSSYLKEINQTQAILKQTGITQTIFRPPYGRIPPWMIKKIANHYRIFMWTYMAGDFDQTINPYKVKNKLLEKVKSGDIIVFHDTSKAYKNMRIILPELLKDLQEKGFIFDKIH